jgi:hypothetical protein
LNEIIIPEVLAGAHYVIVFLYIPYNDVHLVYSSLDCDFLQVGTAFYSVITSSTLTQGLEHIRFLGKLLDLLLAGYL